VWADYHYDHVLLLTPGSVGRRIHAYRGREEEKRGGGEEE